MDEDIFDLRFCKLQISAWKRYYFRKNSKHKASIEIRCLHAAREKVLWHYYLQLWINGKLIDQSRITVEAYDTLSYDASLPKVERTNIEIITLFESEK